MRISDWSSDVCSSDLQASFLLRAIERVLREIEGVHVMALFREIGRHPAAHVAEPDETDACHVFSPHLPSSPAGGECYFPVQFPGRFSTTAAMPSFLSRSVERLVGKECCIQCSSWWSPFP